MTAQVQPHTSWYYLRKVLRLFAKVLIAILLFIIVLFVLIQTPPVQNFARKKIQSYLQNKLHTNVQIGKLYIGLPDIVSLQNVYIEDQAKDTLLSGGKLKANINLFRLFSNVVEINEIQLEDVTATLKRNLPDTVYNFQFIIDAFTGRQQSSNPADTSGMEVDISSILLNNVHLIYQDVITGNDMNIKVNHLTTRIDHFDPDRYIFDVPDIQLNGLKAKIYQSKPLVEVADDPAKDLADAAKPVDFNFSFKNISLENIDLDYRNDVSGFYYRNKIGSLDVEANRVDLPNKIINFANLKLDDATTAIRLLNKEKAKEVAKAVQQNVKSNIQVGGWRVAIGDMQLNKNVIQFDDDSKAASRGMDYSHLLAKDFTLHVKDLKYSSDTIEANITKGNFSEQSGFVLNNLEGELFYSDRGAYLKNLLIRTPASIVRRDIAIEYPSIDALAENPEVLRVQMDLKDSKVLVKDLLVFAPMLRSQPAFRNENDVWYLNGRLRGSLANLNIETLQASGLQDTRLDLSGNLSNLTDPNKMHGTLRISRFVTSRRDLNIFLPRGTLPSNITLPETVSVSGNISGGLKELFPNLDINSSLGRASVQGRLSNITQPERMGYNVSVITSELDLGTIIQDKNNFGMINGTVQAKGQGIDPKNSNATFTGTISSAMFNHYNYSNAKFEGKIIRQHLDAKFTINDPNAHLSFTTTGSVAGEFPALQFQAEVDSIKALPLHFATTDIAFRGSIVGDFVNTDPDNLQGQMLITHAAIRNAEQRFTLDTIRLDAGNNDTGKFLKLASDAFDIELAGDYKLTQIGSVVLNSIQPYFAVMPQYEAAKVSPYDFAFSASIYDKPLWKILVPGLTSMEPIMIHGNFSNVQGWKATADAPSLIYAGNQLNAAHIELGSDQSSVMINATLNHLRNGNAINVYGMSVKGSLANNNGDFELLVHDRQSKEKYHVGVVVKQPAFGDYVFSVKPGQLVLNYNTWSVPADNNISITGESIQVQHLVLTRAGQQLTLNSRNSTANSPIDISFGQFRLSTFSGFMQADTLLIDGILNGNAVVSNVMTQPVFTTDLTINDLSIRQDTVGNASIKVNNTTSNVYIADVRIAGRGNDVALTGQYNVKPGNSSTFDLDLAIRALQLSTIEGATMNSIRNATGSINGEVKLSGNLQEPRIGGELNFNKAAMNVAFLNSYFTIDQEKIVVDNEGLKLNTFTVRDSANNPIVIDGIAATTDFNHYKFNLNVNMDNFRAINTTKRDNSLFYGQLVLNSQMHIGGTESAPVVDGGITITDKTDFTIVLPQEQPGVQDREGIVQFVDMDQTLSDSLLLAPYKCLDNCPLVGFDVAMNIEISKNAVLSMVVDEGNGDFIRMKGEGLLSGGIDQSGKISLTGNYALNEGAYELSFNFIKRKFSIEKGSSITFQGDPTTADLNVRAFYVANTAPLDLVNEQISENSTAIRNTFRQKLPFQVFLKLEGKLMKPVISFDVVLPEEGNYNVSRDVVNTVESRLNELRQEPSELNKQVFSLLLLNRFMAENPFDNNSGGGMNASSFARQSVSKVLTEQLNRLATDLIQGVDINFDVVSSDDYTTGERRDRTDFKVSISKQLLSDRLTVRVGNNFMLEGPQSNAANASGLAGDVALDYKLSRDGRYLLRGYRKNEYQGVVEGYIIETGISFIITVDYNQFGDIFRRKKKIDLMNPEGSPANKEPSNVHEKPQTQNGKG